jgi:hypothetical protein
MLIVIVCGILHLPPTFDNMDSNGLRAISYQVTRKVKAVYNPSYTTDTLIGYTAY